MPTKPITGYRINKDGKIVKALKKISVSERLRMKNSKRVKVARGTR